MGMTEIILLATLHQMHPQVTGYGFKELGDVITRLKPAALLVELQQSELNDLEKPIQGSKVEYNESILPTAKALKIPLHPLEPGGKTRDEILTTYRNSWKKAESHPDYGAYSKFVDLLIAQLKGYWKSPLDVSSGVTVESFRLKHAYQEKLFSVDTPSWEQWNQKFLSAIIKTAKAYPAKRIVVTVGVEHIYWLQDHLKVNNELHLVGLEAALARNP